MTGEPVYVTGSLVEVSGQVATTEGGPVEYWVEYGRTTDYGNSTPRQTSTFLKNENRRVWIDVTGLELSTTYHYRVCAADSQQTGASAGCGEDRTFTTQPVQCGQTITESFTLVADMTCERPGDNTWDIGAHGVVIDLGGHLFRGTAVPGIVNSGYDDVTIHNGGIANWVRPEVVIEGGADRNRVLGVSGSVDVSGGTGHEISGSTGGVSAADTANLVVADHYLFGSSSRGGTGISISTDGALIADSEVGGGSLSRGIVINGDDNRILRNRVHSNTQGNIVVESGARNVIGENEVYDAWTYIQEDTPDGIRVLPDATRTLLRANFAHDNEGDGIHVLRRGTRLHDNRADSNGDLGIEAVEGVIDLGGNTASGNGNPLQCLNISCE